MRCSAGAADVQQGVRVLVEGTVDAAFEDELIRAATGGGCASSPCTGSCEHHEAREVQHRERAERQQCVCRWVFVDDFQQTLEAIDGSGPDWRDNREHFMRHQGLGPGAAGPRGV